MFEKQKGQRQLFRNHNIKGTRVIVSFKGHGFIQMKVLYYQQFLNGASREIL